jgi:hypothetical protein
MIVKDLLCEKTETSKEEKLTKLFGADRVEKNNSLYASMPAASDRYIKVKIPLTKDSATNLLYVTEFMSHGHDKVSYNVWLNGVKYNVIGTKFIPRVLKSSDLYKKAIEAYNNDHTAMY